MPHQLFDMMSVDGVRAIRDGRIAVESLPSEGGRWGLSIVLRPRGPLRDQVAELTFQATALAGEQHLRTGSHGAAHLTVRALEPHSVKPLDSAKVNRYVAAARRAARGIDSIPLEVRGLAVTSGTLMACAEDVAGTGQQLRHRLQVELGETGWLENRHFPDGRDPIWYVTLINFTGPLLDAEGFIDWFDANRDRSIGEEVFSQVDLCPWQFDGSRMTPEDVVSIPLDRVKG